MEMPQHTGLVERYEDASVMHEETLISVIVPAYNAAETVTRAIDSARSQNIPAMEIIVVDDGSVDGTADAVVASIRPGERIQLLQLSRNSGVSAARNAGIRAARGKFLAFLDADDTWLPGKLEKQLAVISKDESITLVSCNSRLLSESGNPLKEGHRNRPPAEGRDAWKTLLRYNFLPTPTVLTHHHLVVELGGFNEELAVGEDLDLWIRLALRGRVVVLKEILTNYYDQAGSLMKRHGEQTLDIVAPMLEKHLLEQRERLSRKEVRSIRGFRSFQIGCNMYFSGIYLPSIPAFLRASFYGTRPIKSLLYVPRALLMACIGWFALRRA